jgi:aromatic-L-amino-acid decarboxylase
MADDSYRHPMNYSEFRKHAHDMVDFMCDYYEGLEQKNVLSTVQPGYLSKLLPDSAPEEGEPWENIMKDIKSYIMPGVTHWQHPSFFAFFPSNSSPPGLLGEMLSGMFNVVGFNWICSPACTELETIVLDWMAKALALPDAFLSHGKGGGVIQGTASEAAIVTLLAAKTKMLKRYASTDMLKDGEILAKYVSKMTVYFSDQAHSSIKKACHVVGIPEHNMRIIKSNGNMAMDVDLLTETLKIDKEKGLIPFYVVGTIGTTSSTAIDPLQAIVEAKGDMWFHIDAALAGPALLCEEYREKWLSSTEFDSFTMNAHKWMLTNFDCSLLWTRNRSDLIDALTITPEYLRNKASESGLVIDYRDWQLPLGRRFRSLKLWFVIRTYGLSGLKKYIRHVSSPFNHHNIILAYTISAIVRKIGTRRFSI